MEMGWTAKIIGLGFIVLLVGSIVLDHALFGRRPGSSKVHAGPAADIHERGHRR